jgi:hypothetical protein
MAEAQEGEVRFFISYASSDYGIASALYEELREIDKKRVHCFLDTQSIDSGVGWEEQLTHELKQADWLICVYTGEQSEFCGYEIGVFAEANGVVHRSADSRLVCLHDVQPPLPLPAVFRSYQNRMVVFPPTQKFATGTFDEAAFYTRAPLSRFFEDIYKYKNLYLPGDASESARQVQTQVRQVKRLTEAFKAARASDVLADTPTQLGMEIAVPATAAGGLLHIPDEAVVRGTYESLGLLGLMPARIEGKLPETTWRAVRDVQGTKYRAVPSWMERLEKDMVNAANQMALDGVEATFASRDQRIFRTILSRHILYESGNHKFEVLFVQTLPRQFLGKTNTSMMLAGLVLASRFRFAYLEEPESVAARFADSLALDQFEANCWQLRYDLDRSQHEAIEFGLMDPLIFVKAFGEQNRALAEKLLAQSAASRDQLLTTLPQPGEHVTETARPGVKAAVGQFLRSVEPINSQFLTTALDVFRNEVLSQLEQQPKAGW